MSIPLQPAVQKVHDILVSRNIPTNIVTFATTTHTASQAAQAIGCEVAHIAKSLIFCTKESRRRILVLASGINQVNIETISSYLGELIEKADASLVKMATGFVIGGVAPIGHLVTLDTYIDQDLLSYHLIWASAGTPYTVFSITPAELVELTQAKIIAIH